VVVLGRIVGAHGLRGQVRVRYFGDGPDNLLSAEQLWLAEQSEDADPDCYSVISGGLGRGGEARVGLEGIFDRDGAQALKGLFVLANEADLPPPEEGAYYWHQLVGCRVESSEGRVIGEVVELWETGAHDVLVVRDERGRQHLLPTARELMTEVDLAQRRITVELIPGLLELD
jgi:16S rRNA processing protein RimM